MGALTHTHSYEHFFFSHFLIEALNIFELFTEKCVSLFASPSATGWYGGVSKNVVHLGLNVVYYRIDFRVKSLKTG